MMKKTATTVGCLIQPGSHKIYLNPFLASAGISWNLWTVVESAQAFPCFRNTCQEWVCNEWIHLTSPKFLWKYVTYRTQGDALGSKAEQHMLFEYLMLSLERDTLVQSNPWILTCNGKFGGSIPSNHSGQREAESCYSSLPLHKVYSSVKPIDIPKAQCIHWGKLDLSPGGVTAFPRAHLTPRSCTWNCRGLITLNYRTVLCHCLPRLEWISAEEQSC